MTLKQQFTLSANPFAVKVDCILKKFQMKEMDWNRKYHWQCDCCDFTKQYKICRW